MNPKSIISHIEYTDEQLDVALKAVKIIRGRHKRLGEMSEQIINLYQLVHIKEALLRDHYGSMSWKITRPLRCIKRLINI